MSEKFQSLGTEKYASTILILYRTSQRYTVCSIYMYTPTISDTYKHSVIALCQKKSNVMQQKSSHLLYSYFIEHLKYTL